MKKISILSRFKLANSNKTKAWVYFVGFSVGFFLLKALAINVGPRISDENLYFYAGYLISKGILPYRDFFIANLPTQAFFYAIIIKVFGFNLQLFKLLLTLINLGSATLLYKLISGKHGRWTGVFSSAFFLFSMIILVTSDFATGVHEATFFLIVSWYWLSRSPKLAGLALFMSLAFRRYMFPAAFGLVLLLVLRRKIKTAITYTVFALLPYVAVNLALYLIFKGDFVNNAWEYHLLKVDANSQFDIYTEFMTNSIFLVLFASGAVFILLKEVYNSIFKKKFVAGISGVYFDVGLSCIVVIALQYIFFGFFSNVFLLYLTTVIPFLSVLAGLSLTVFLPNRSRRIALFILIAISLLNAWVYQNKLMRSFVVEDFEQIISGIDKETEADDELFGSYLVTPIIALNSGREVNEYAADLNIQRYKTGSISLEETTRLATESAMFFQFVAVDELTNRIIDYNPNFLKHEVVRENCVVYSSHEMEWKGRNQLLVWKCS